MSSFNRRSFLSASTVLAGTAALSSGMTANAATPRPPKYGPEAGVAKLNANENPFGPSPAALRAMMEASAKGAYYVGESVTRLTDMIAERHGLTRDHIMLSSGSSGALTYLALAASQKGSIVGPDLFWETTTAMALAQTGATLKRLPKTEDLTIDLAAMEQALRDDVSMVHVTNPNNPTGSMLPATTLREFCKRVSKRATVLMDEAYNELTDNPEENTMIPLVKAGYDVVVARTFSKIYGLAGMRVGYLIGTPEKILEVRKYGLGSYALNQAGLAAAVASYNDEHFINFSRSNIFEAREMIASAVKANGLDLLPSSTNFMFVDLGTRNAEAFRAAMAERNVLIRGIYRDYDNWSRVSTGLLPDVQQYIAALPAVLDQIPLRRT